MEFKGNGFGGHTKENFNKAIENALQNNVKIAFSNPCFELWIILHFEYRDTESSRDDIQDKALEKINSLLPQGKKLKNFERLYSLLKEKTPSAIKFAKKLSENEVQRKNPSTSVYRLVNALTAKN